MTTIYLKTILFYRKFLLLIFPLIISVSAYGQTADSVRYGFLPSISFDTDFGINAAMDVQRFDYSDGIVPFKSFSKYRASFQSIGAFSFSVFRDQVRTFGTDKRSTADLLISQNFGNYFTGFTVNEGFDRRRFDTTSYYQFDSFLLNVGLTTRVPISDIIGIKRTDIKVGVRVVHERPFDLEPDSYMNQVRPNGWDGSTYSFIELGYIKEQRDSEFRMEDGYLISLSGKTSVPFLSASLIGQIYTDFRFYRELTGRAKAPQIIFAQRFLMNQTLGDIPYWFAPSLGGAGSTRGLIYRRYVGQGEMQSNTEIRTWLFGLPIWDSQVGINLFMDNGMVYNRSLTAMQHATTVGFGGFMSIFTKDYIVKYEMGFSEEGVGVYIGSGFSF